MTTPTMRDLHTNVYLSNMSIGYKNGDYIAERVLPIVPVSKQSDKVAVYNQADWFRDEAKQRAPGGEPNIGDYKLGTAVTYTCLPWNFAKLLPDEVRENADDPFAPERTAIEFATDRVLLSREKRVADLLFNTTTFTSYTATAAALTGGGDVAWDTYATSTPLKDIDVMRSNVIQQIGRDPNTLIMGFDVWKALKEHPDLVERIKYTSNSPVTMGAFANLIEIPNILVGKAVYNSSAEAGTASYGFIWGKYVLLCYVPPAPALFIPALGYTFVWKQRTTERQRIDLRKSDLFTVEEHTDEAVLSTPSAYLLSAVVS